MKLTTPPRLLPNIFEVITKLGESDFGGIVEELKIDETDDESILTNEVRKALSYALKSKVVGQRDGKFYLDVNKIVPNRKRLHNGKRLNTHQKAPKQLDSKPQPRRKYARKSAKSNRANTNKNDVQGTEPDHSTIQEVNIMNRRSGLEPFQCGESTCLCRVKGD